MDLYQFGRLEALLEAAREGTYESASQALIDKAIAELRQLKPSK